MQIQLPLKFVVITLCSRGVFFILHLVIKKTCANNNSPLKHVYLLTFGDKNTPALSTLKTRLMIDGWGDQFEQERKYSSY